MVTKTIGTERRILTDQMLSAVRGGFYFDTDEEYYCYEHKIHFGCGGHILNCDNPARWCKCDKCGEENFWYRSFFNTHYEKD